MKYFSIIFAILMLIDSALLSAVSLDSDALELQQAYNELQMHKREHARQMAFIASFPHTASDFKRLFNSIRQDQLGDGSKYIFELERLAQNHASDVFKLMLKLAGELEWTSGAPNYWQFVLMKIAIDNPFEFASQYALLNDRQKFGVVRFLTTSKNGPAIGFHQFINILRRIDKNPLADELEAGLY